MFDSPVLNVVIGLVLIYLLYSLLISIVGEMVSTMLNLRALLLRVAIERMLNDGYYPRRDRLRNALSVVVKMVRWLLLRPHQDFKGSLAGRFYDHPSIKYLSKTERSTLFQGSHPSYLTDQYFADTLVRMLLEKGIGPDERSRIASALKLNTIHMQARTAQNVRSLHSEAAGDPDAFRERLQIWFNETMDRTNGWYKRKMQRILLVLGLVVAVAFNVDSIRIARLLSRDSKAREQLVNLGISMARDSSRYSAFTTTGGAGVKTQAVLDSGYARVNEDLGAARLLLGLGWGFDTLSTEKLVCITKAEDSVRYQRIRTTAAAMLSVQQRDTAHRSGLLTAGQARDSASVALMDSSRLLRLFSSLPSNDSTKSRILALRKDSLNLSAFLITTAMRLTDDSLWLRKLAVMQAQNLAALNQATGTLFKRLPVVDTSNGEVKVYGDIAYSGSRFCYVLSQSTDTTRLVGFLLTALMLSLGAPFWFDLLNRLISLRGAGTRPDPTAKEVGKESPVAPHLHPAPAQQEVIQPVFANAAEELVWTYRDGLMALPPVRAVFTVYSGTTCTIQINVTSAGAVALVNNWLLARGVDATSLGIQIQVTGSATASSLGHPQAIANLNRGAGNFGSLGCILKEAASKEVFLLSCWHVLKGDTSYDSPRIGQPVIIDNDERHLADLETGGIWGPLDYGLARCSPTGSVRDNKALKDSLNLTGPLTHRAIEQRDLKEHTEIQFFDIFSQKPSPGLIYGSTAQVQVDYADKPRIVTDVLMLVRSAEEIVPVSEPGNSGALVFDKKGVAIAMIIARDNMYTYAVKLSNLFSIHTDKTFA